VKYAIDLHTNAHGFLKGYRNMVQVQSTWFPVYDRNPQKFVPTIFEASGERGGAAGGEVRRGWGYLVLARRRGHRLLNFTQGLRAP
jgi:predicted acyl esterase